MVVLAVILNFVAAVALRACWFSLGPWLRLQMARIHVFLCSCFASLQMIGLGVDGACDSLHFCCWMSAFLQAGLDLCGDWLGSGWLMFCGCAL